MNENPVFELNVKNIAIIVLIIAIGNFVGIWLAQKLT